MSGYDWDTYRGGIGRARAAIESVRKEATAHPICQRIDGRADVAVFIVAFLRGYFGLQAGVGGTSRLRRRNEAPAERSRQSRFAARAGRRSASTGRLTMAAELCGGQDGRRQEAVETATLTLEARSRPWDGIDEAMG